MRTINTQIHKIGLFYLAHYNRTYIKCNFDSFSIDIPEYRVREFCDLFPEIDFESGEFIDVLNGKYLRVTYTDDLKIYSLHNIIKDIDYML